MRGGLESEKLPWSQGRQSFRDFVAQKGNWAPWSFHGHGDTPMAGRLMMVDVIENPIQTDDLEA